MNSAIRKRLHKGTVIEHYKITGEAIKLANAFGYLYPAEVSLIQALAKSLKEGATVVCIGAGTGTGSLAIAEINRNAKLYTVDISEGGPTGGLLNEKNAFDNAGIHPYPKQILGDSKEVHTKWDDISKGSKIDLLFIDGDHSESGLQGDIDGWLPYVARGGYVVFHDYNSINWSAVADVVDRNMFTKSWRYVHFVDTTIAFQLEKPL